MKIKKEYLKEIEEQRQSKTDNEIYVCSNCGSPDVDEARWVGINTVAIGGVVDEDVFCNDCLDFTRIITLQEWLDRDEQ